MKTVLSINGHRKYAEKLVLFFLLLMCIPTNEAYEFLDPLLRFFRYVGLSVALLVFITTRLYKEKKIRAFYFWAIWMLVASALNATDLVAFFKMIYPIFASVILTQYYVNQRKEKIITDFAIVFAVLALINAVVAITGVFGEIYSGGLQGNYLFGIRVNISFLLPYALGLNFMNAQIDGRRGIFFLVATVASLVYFVIFEWVSTGIVTIGVFLIVYLFLNIFYFNRRFLKTAVLLFVIVCVGFVFFMSKLHVFEWFLVGVLKEDVTLDNRTLLWEQAFEYLKGLHWLYGFGFKHGYKFTVSWWFSADHPHNEYLEVLFCYGVIGLAIYVKMIINQVKVTLKMEKSRIQNAVLAMLLACCLMHAVSHNIMAVYPFITYVIIMNVDKFNKNGQRKQMRGVDAVS